MARMIPDNLTHLDFNDSWGEEKIYNELKGLPEEYIVFHSVHWHKRDGGRIRWGEADFTIFNPRRGILVVEVKGGEIHCTDGTWWQTNRSTKEEKIINPVVQAERSKFRFVDMLTPENRQHPLFYVELAVWFPDIPNIEAIRKLPPNCNSAMVLTESSLKNPLKAIENAFDYYGMYVCKQFNQSDVKAVVDKLSPNFDAIPSLSCMLGKQENEFIRMTKEQSILLDYLDEQRIAAIQGAAGTGKTMLALEKAKRLSVDGKVLFLCFNTLLLDTLREKYASQMPNVEFYNLMQLAKCGNKEELITSYLDSYNKDNWPYRDIIIDEGQDFLSDHIISLRMIADDQNGSFYVFFDRNQYVQQRHYEEDFNGEEALENKFEWLFDMDCKLILSINCRNTERIATTSYKPIGLTKVKLCSENQGEKPILHIVNDLDCAKDCIGKIIRAYTDQGIEKSDIAVLSAKSLKKSLFHEGDMVGSYRLISDNSKNGILFKTARMFKGLESAVVILVDMDDTSFTSEESRQVLYVGASRAKHILEFVSVMEDAAVKRLATQLTDSKVDNPRMTIATQLKVKLV